MTFGEKIKEARKFKSLTQKQLAEKIGAKHNSISDWENNKNKPDPDTIELLCGVLEISPNYLLDVVSEDISPADKLLLKKYHTLDPSGQEHVNTVLKWESERMEQLKQAQMPVAKSPIRLIQYYQRLASAGTGQYIFDDVPSEQIEIPDIPKYRKVRYALGVNGRSMEPDYLDGEVVLVEPVEEVELGEIGIFINDGDAFIKKRGGDFLISLNKPEYEDIPLSDSTRCIGRVIDKLET